MEQYMAMSKVLKESDFRLCIASMVQSICQLACQEGVLNESIFTINVQT